MVPPDVLSLQCLCLLGKGGHEGLKPDGKPPKDYFQNE